MTKSEQRFLLKNIDGGGPTRASAKENARNDHRQVHCCSRFLPERGGGGGDGDALSTAARRRRYFCV